MMKNKKTILAIVVALIIVALGVVAYQKGLFDMGPSTDFASFRSGQHNLYFDYPRTYYMKETEPPGEGSPDLAVVIVEDTVENRAVLDGTATEPREGPPSITIEVYPNPDQLPAETWAAQSPNWGIRTSEPSPAPVGRHTGVAYTWDGLYQGRSTIMTVGTKAYVFSVTWLTPEDILIADYDALLASVTFEKPVEAQ